VPLVICPSLATIVSELQCSLLGKIMPKWIIISLILLFTLLMPVMAQDNLLQNGGFEAEQYNLVSIGADSTQFNVPIAWGGVTIVQEGGPTWQNIQPNGFPHTFNFVHSGGRSFNISRGWATFTAYIYQTVAVVPNTPVRGGAFAFMQGHPSAVARVGIDPTGGVNPFAETVIWTQSYDKNRWLQLEVSATAQANFVTLFLFATQAELNNPNDIYWDDAYLLGQAGNATAQPEAAAPVATQQVAEPTIRLNVRSGAGTQFERIGGIVPGETYPVISVDANGWVQIAFNGGVGYVSQRFVQIRDGVPTGAAPVAGDTSAPTVASLEFFVDYQLNMRAAPNPDSQLLVQIPWEATIFAIGRTADNVWIQVQYNGQTGWVVARYGHFQSGRITDLRVVQ
jgi:uncharacterized protein YraI